MTRKPRAWQYRGDLHCFSTAVEIFPLYPEETRALYLARSYTQRLFSQKALERQSAEPS